jgi:hypothetical protein
MAKRTTRASRPKSRKSMPTFDEACALLGLLARKSTPGKRPARKSAAAKRANPRNTGHRTRAKTLTIRSAISRMQSQRVYLADERVLDQLYSLSGRYGPDASGRWDVVDSDFHGGDVISSHRSPLAAVRASLRRHTGHDAECTCGGSVVRLADEDE